MSCFIAFLLGFNFKMYKKLYFRFFTLAKKLLFNIYLIIFGLVSCSPVAVLIDFKKCFVPSPDDELFCII